MKTEDVAPNQHSLKDDWRWSQQDRQPTVITKTHLLRIRQALECAVHPLVQDLSTSDRVKREAKVKPSERGRTTVPEDDPSLWHERILDAEAANSASCNLSGSRQAQSSRTRVRFAVLDDASSDEEQDQVGELPSFGKGVDSSLANQVIIMVDASNSMRTCDVGHSNKQGGSRLSAVLEVIPRFIDQQANDATEVGKVASEFTLLSFNSEATVHFNCLDAQLAKNAVRSTCINAKSSTEYRIAISALRALVSEMNEAGHNPQAVLLSDGRPGDARGMIACLQGLLCDFPSLRIHTIGFGALADFAYLQQIASLASGEFALSSLDIRSLDYAFSSASRTITAVRSSLTDSSTHFESDFSKRTGAELRIVQYEEPHQSRKGKGWFMMKARRSWYVCTGDFASGLGWKFLQKEGHALTIPVTRRKRPFTRGGMRLVYGFEDPSVLDGNKCTRMVAKISKYAGPTSNSFDAVKTFAQSHGVAAYAARVFNNFLQAASIDVQICFVPCYLYEVLDLGTLPDDEPHWMIAERYLPGVFFKYNSNNGYVNNFAPQSEISQAFSHFSHHLFDGIMMILDVQGVLNAARKHGNCLLLSDPQVVSYSKIFGPGDLGLRGIRAFFRNHKCGPTCAALGLSQVSFDDNGQTKNSTHAPHPMSCAAQSASDPAGLIFTSLSD